MSLQVPVNDRFVKVSPSAGTTVIDTDFPVLAAADVEVWRQRAGVAVKLGLSTDYTMSLVGNQLGARVTLSLASLAGDVYIVAGARASERMTSFIEGQFRSADINDELTSLMIIVQELRTLALRTVRFPVTGSDLAAEIPAGAAAGLLGLSAAGALELRSSTGSTFHIATTTPSGALGIDNDVCLVVNAADAAHGKVFAKTGGAWVDKGSIRGPAGAGDVAGPASSTDNAFARYDLATGKVLQNGVVGADDTGNIFGAKYIEIEEIAAPAAPVAGKRRLYARAGSFYSIGNAGGEAALGGSSGSSHGQCRLIKQGADLALFPHNGNKLIINGVAQTIPAAGVVLAPTNPTGTTYFIYAWMNGVTMTLEASTTVPAVDASTGVKIKTGDASRTLVGMARSITGPAWVDTDAQRFVISYFNRRDIRGINSLTSNFTTTSTSYVEVMPSNRVEFLAWADETSQCMVTSYNYNSGSDFTLTRANFDGSVDGIPLGSFGTNGYPCTMGHGAMLTDGYHYATARGKVNTSGTGTWQGNASIAQTNVVAIIKG